MSTRAEHYERFTKDELVQRIVALEEGSVKGLDLRERGPLTGEQAEAVADEWLDRLPDNCAYKGELVVTYLDETGQVWFTIKYEPKG